jgi:hypothetical protein
MVRGCVTPVFVALTQLLNILNIPSPVEAFTPMIRQMFDSGGEQIKCPLFALTGTPGPRHVMLKLPTRFLSVIIRIYSSRS